MFPVECREGGTTYQGNLEIDVRICFVLLGYCSVLLGYCSVLLGDDNLLLS